MVIAVTCFALAACGKKKDEAPPAPAPVAAAPAAVGSAGSGSAAAAEPAGSASSGAAAEVPTEVDFEAQARTDIDEKNVDTRVKAIEQELGQ
jgi:hypothetical protein